MTITVSTAAPFTPAGEQALLDFLTAVFTYANLPATDLDTTVCVIDDDPIV